MTDSGSPQDEGGNAATATEATPVARLSRLKINRFRQVAPGTELRFDDGINVLLGRNGTGKTTLLELIVAVARGDLRAYQNESFELELELMLSGETLMIWIENSPSTDKSSAGIFGRDTQALEWSYRIHYCDRSGALHRIQATKGRTTLGDSAHPESPLFTPGFYDDCICLVLGIKPTDFTGFRYTSQRLVLSLLRLDEGLDIFRGMVEGHALPRIGSPLTVRLFTGYPWNNPEDPMPGFLGLFMNYVPASLLEHLLERGDAVHSATNISISHDQWELLNVLRGLFDAKDLQVTLQLTEREELVPGNFQSTFGKPVFRVTTHRGTTYTHDRLSYGEKRLLTFLYHAAANPQILVADELVNGLHHEWIQTCLDAIQGQAFLTSQNPLLLDHLPFSSAEEVQRRFVLCDRDGEGNWLWRNMNPDEAASFYRAYEVGIQHVSEILETKGLW